MNDVTLVQCDAIRGCGTVYALDMRGSTDQQRTDTEAALDAGLACPECARAHTVRPVATITP